MVVSIGFFFFKPCQVSETPCEATIFLKKKNRACVGWFIPSIQQSQGPKSVLFAGKCFGSSVGCAGPFLELFVADLFL